MPKRRIEARLRRQTLVCGSFLRLADKRACYPRIFIAIPMCLILVSRFLNSLSFLAICWIRMVVAFRALQLVASTRFDFPFRYSTNRTVTELLILVRLR